MSFAAQDIYTISPEFKAERRHFMVSIGIGLFIAVGANCLLLSATSDKPDFFALALTWPFILGLGVFFGLYFAGISYYFLRELNRTSVMLTPTSIVRRIGKKQTEVPWHGIGKIQIIYTVERKPLAINLFGQRLIPITLIGFAQTEELLQAIEQALPNEVQREAKYQRLNWQSPLVPWLLVLGVWALIVPFFLLGNIDIELRMDLLGVVGFVLQVALGIAWILFPGLSRMHPKYRRFELIVGVCNLIVGIAAIVIVYVL